MGYCYGVGLGEVVVLIRECRCIVCCRVLSVLCDCICMCIVLLGSRLMLLFDSVVLWLLKLIYMVCVNCFVLSLSVRLWVLCCSEVWICGDGSVSVVVWLKYSRCCESVWLFVISLNIVSVWCGLVLCSSVVLVRLLMWVLVSGGSVIVCVVFMIIVLFMLSICVCSLVVSGMV